MDPSKSGGGRSPGPLTSVMEDYLEAIFDLDQAQKVVRVKDIARRMGVKMPTVTSMLKTLHDRGLVQYRKYEYVDLTAAGRRVGKEMRRRHGLLANFLTGILKVDPATADEEACRMEHSLSTDTLERLTDFMHFVCDCPRAGANWLERFEEYRRRGSPPEDCPERSAVFSAQLKQRINREDPKDVNDIQS
ncbi:metal-dependent transcriptional regulator [Desulfoglaeba alkanexedens]|uniref:Transcriptional regulator MntR n=1 Tax=Desulfoglaeba alkanexedens ALDC TaxID=980445 RepID=A0A4V1ERR6_9BACT|nr:metal-dependent transcriptional regulator [Desulfoglaeba alkanexedens]QCQ22571.1 metal-dependent transcriptional regulator [Desulfoglaeba alkanexedens ALDC]